MIFIAVVCIIAALFYCVAAAIVGGMTWRSTLDWHFLAGACLYTAAAILLTLWLLGSCA